MAAVPHGAVRRTSLRDHELDTSLSSRSLLPHSRQDGVVNVLVVDDSHATGFMGKSGNFFILFCYSVLCIYHHQADITSFY